MTKRAALALSQIVVSEDQHPDGIRSPDFDALISTLQQTLDLKVGFENDWR
jgi:hypothetical protein